MAFFDLFKKKKKVTQEAVPDVTAEAISEINDETADEAADDVIDEVYDETSGNQEVNSSKADDINQADKIYPGNEIKAAETPEADAAAREEAVEPDESKADFEPETEVAELETAEAEYADEKVFDLNNTEAQVEAELQEAETLSETVPEKAAEPEKKKGFFKKIFEGLDKTRKNILGGVENVLKAFVKIDDEMFDELEEALILADMGVNASGMIIAALKDRVKTERVTDAALIKDMLIQEISEILDRDSGELELTTPSVILVIGVNGVGKTTTIGKLANNYISNGKKVLLAAADTFRAAAIDQLEVWAQRSNTPIIKHKEGADPAAVVYDAIQSAKARKTDILICDTAGRLQNKKNLMDELGKISRIISREYPEAKTEVFIVLDATTGQNALRQAEVFKEVAGITGIVLTKLDGTAKGGIVIAIKNDLQIPVRFIGIGEGIDDLRPFDSKEFAKALFGSEEKE